MVYLRFTPIAHNVWAVKRSGNVKCAEVVLRKDGCRLLPLSPYALQLEELQSIATFMSELPDILEPGRDYAKAR